MATSVGDEVSLALVGASVFLVAARDGAAVFASTTSVKANFEGLFPARSRFARDIPFGYCYASQRRFQASTPKMIISREYGVYP